MVAKYWVGGGASTNWNATGNTNWSDTDGGANNAAVPGTTDHCIFNGNSGVGASVISAGITVQKLICTGFGGTITHNSAITLILNTADVDTLILGSGMTYTAVSSTSLITLSSTSGTADLTTNGKRLGALTISGVGGTFRLLDAIRVDAVAGSLITVANGVFNGNGFAVTTNIFSSNTANVRTIILGGGTYTIGGAAAAGITVWNLATITNLTFTKGASNIVIPSNGLAGVRTFAGGGLTYNDVTVAANSGRGAIAISGANTFVNLPVGEGNSIELPVAVTTIQTAPNWVGTSALPILVNSITVGSVATISVPSGAMTHEYGGLRDITGSGGATFTATNVYDFGNNTGWAITPPGGALTAADIRAAVGLASANLDTQLSTIDDLLDTEVAAIKAKTDSLTFTVAGQVDANIESVNTVTVTGNGAPGTTWGP